MKFKAEGILINVCALFLCSMFFYNLNGIKGVLSAIIGWSIAEIIKRSIVWYLDKKWKENKDE